ncbi:flavodoxin family protein [Clostridium tyrobutyricum]|uniref:flavodoxin family protein n=1 Tax=Clostridium tyrobutyricum TaxID=1519 RepID=UPI0011CC7E08|nr:flavodoxin family protein [Clostridium tyrobutyricum]
MSKNVLVISSSPRKGGNSDILCDQFILGAEEAGNYTEKVFLRDKNINCCTACYACVTNGGKCVQEDDMEQILEKMLKADVIVLATPVYFYTVSAQLKMVIDRTFAKYTQINNKEFYFIATAENHIKKTLERTIESLRGFTDCLKSSVEKGIIYGTGVSGKGEIKHTDAMKQAYDMGKSVI